MFIARKIKIFDKKQKGLEPTEINIKKAIHFVGEAWKNVTATTIRNCWAKTGILPSDNEEKIEDAMISIENFANYQRDEVDNLIDRLPLSSALTAEEYISIDDDEDNELPNEDVTVKTIQPTIEDSFMEIIENKK